MLESDWPNVFNTLGTGARLRSALTHAVNEALAEPPGDKRRRLHTIFTAGLALVNPGQDATGPAVSLRQNLAGVNVIRITYDDGLDPEFVPLPEAFTLAPARTITRVEVQGNFVLLHYSGTRYVAGDNPTVAYTQPAANQVRLRDDAGNEAGSSVASAVTVL